jgi:hypothetical protein
MPLYIVFFQCKGIKICYIKGLWYIERNYVKIIAGDKHYQNLKY